MNGLKYRRRHGEISQAEVARAIGVSPSHYAKIERGEVQPKLQQLVMLAKFFEVSIEDLM